VSGGQSDALKVGATKPANVLIDEVLSNSRNGIIAEGLDSSSVPRVLKSTLTRGASAFLTLAAKVGAELGIQVGWEDIGDGHV
jgi:hypothetical protein